MLKPKIAIIGAGLSGLSCAKKLCLAGFSPTVIEKSRGIGGRLSTRRIGNQFSFDHGAQYVSANGYDFNLYLNEAMEKGVAGEWCRMHSNANANAKPKSKPKIVGLKGMSNLVTPLAENLDLHFNSAVKSINPHNNGWEVETINKLGKTTFDIVVITIPAPQARELLSTQLVISSDLNKVQFSPCLAAMIAFEDKISIETNTFMSPNSELAWCARNSSKPNQQLLPDCWIVHASAGWSEKNIDSSKDEIAKNLLKIFSNTFHIKLPKVQFLAGHKWRYAFACLPLKKDYILSSEKTLIVGGDWCLGNRAEDAYDTGLSIASFISNTF